MDFSELFEKIKDKISEFVDTLTDWIEENKDAQTVPPLTFKHNITSKD